MNSETHDYQLKSASIFRTCNLGQSHFKRQIQLLQFILENNSIFCVPLAQQPSSHPAASTSANGIAVIGHQYSIDKTGQFQINWTNCEFKVKLHWLRALVNIIVSGG